MGELRARNGSAPLGPGRAGHGSSDYLFVPVRCVPVNAYVIVEDWF